MENEISEHQSLFDYFERKAGHANSDAFLDNPSALDDRSLLIRMFSLLIPNHLAESYASSLFDRFGSLGEICAAPDYLLANEMELPSTVRFMLKSIAETSKRSLREDLGRTSINIGSSSTLMEYLRANQQYEKTERLHILYLDKKNNLIRDEVPFRGTVDHTPLYPREIVKRALELDASSVILAHNHPSGDPTPSRPDIEMTQLVINALKSVGIETHDHIIIGNNGRHTSMRSEGRIISLA